MSVRTPIGLLLIMLLMSGCGKKGPPLPPLVRLPAAPQDFVAVRRGSSVAIAFALPSTNADRTSPADLARVDVYALTGPSTLTPDEILRRGTRVGSVVANPPADPDTPADPGATASSREGLDQGATARLSDVIDVGRVDGQLRSYLAVGVNGRGRRGAVSARALIPLDGSPPSPPPAAIDYDEAEIRVTWPDAALGTGTRIGYHVYPSAGAERPLTVAPIDAPGFVDRAIEWGTRRCYVVRTVDRMEGINIESDASAPSCVTLEDTFPPAAPTGLRAVADVATVNLIWAPNTEPDLAGYVVLRAIAPATDLTPVNATPTIDTTLTDTVPSLARVSYAIRAVDKAGNPGPLSARVEETAR